MSNMIIGLGGCGTNIIKKVLESSDLTDVKLYAIDSITNVKLNDINRITHIPIVSDDKTGSGRNRERGSSMYNYHEQLGEFDQMYEDAVNAKSPVLVVTSAAGGTGSGSVVCLCKALLERDVQVIPIIICPNKNDPAAFHLNTNDLMMELGKIGIETYSIFENRKGDADYDPINAEVVNLIEIIFGKKYDETDLDSIDDSDLDVILNTPGRFIATSAEASSIPVLQKEITSKIFSGFQPPWESDDITDATIMTAYSLTSMYASQDFREVFKHINERLSCVYDEYRNIVADDNNGIATASIIIAGLPRPNVKTINEEYNEVSGIDVGIKKSVRPGFLNRKKPQIINTVDKDNPDLIVNKYNWK